MEDVAAPEHWALFRRVLLHEVVLVNLPTVLPRRQVVIPTLSPHSYVPSGLLRGGGRVARGWSKDRGRCDRSVGGAVEGIRGDVGDSLPHTERQVHPSASTSVSNQGCHEVLPNREWEWEWDARVLEHLYRPRSLHLYTFGGT